MEYLNTNRFSASGKIISKIFLKTHYKKKVSKRKDGRHLFFVLENRITAYKSQFLPVKAYDACAKQIALYCKKGDYIQLEGRLKCSKQITSNGKIFYKIELLADHSNIDREYLYRKRKLEKKAKDTNKTIQQLWDDKYINEFDDNDIIEDVIEDIIEEIEINKVGE